MKLQFYNSPEPEKFNVDLLPKELPEFLSYEPNWQRMEETAAKYAHIKNIVVIGHGGSITGFMGFYESLKPIAKKNAYFVQTVDPDYLFDLKNRLSEEDTLVIAVSKSGETTTQIEALFQFVDYPKLFITGEGSGLAQIAEKMGAEIFIHPTIGGRYTGFTEVLLLPAILCGLPAKEFFEGGRSFHKKFVEENESWQMASALWQLEQKGYVDVFMPFYSHYLFPWNLVIVQLCHESFGKGGLGGSYLAFEAPESQHHTNQRFFGGIKNMVGVFIGLEKFENNLVTSVPESLADVPIKIGKLREIDNIPLATAMKFEMDATGEDAADNKIPMVEFLVGSRTARDLGEFLAFWQMYAVYGSLVRNVNPFNQPQVEVSKNISFQKRQNYQR